MRLLLIFFMLITNMQAYAKPKISFPKAVYYPVNGEDEMTEMVFAYGLQVEKTKKLKLEQSYVLLDTPKSLQSTLDQYINKKERRIWRSVIEKQTANWIPQNGPMLPQMQEIIYSPSTDRIYMYFTTQLILNIAEARRLIVEIAEGLASELNSFDHFSRCYHHGDEFTASDFIIWIDFETYFGKYVDPLVIGTILLEGGVTHFWAWNGKKYYGDSWEYRYEPYYKSRQYVLIERQQQAAEYMQVMESGAVNSGIINEGGATFKQLGLQYVPPTVVNAVSYSSAPRSNYSTIIPPRGESVIQTNYGIQSNIPKQSQVVGTNYNPLGIRDVRPTLAAVATHTNGLVREAPALAPLSASKTIQTTPQGEIPGFQAQPNACPTKPIGPPCNIPPLPAGQMIPQVEDPYPAVYEDMPCPMQPGFVPYGYSESMPPNCGSLMSCPPQMFPGQIIENSRQNNSFGPAMPYPANNPYETMSCYPSPPANYAPIYGSTSEDYTPIRGRRFGRRPSNERFYAPSGSSVIEGYNSNLPATPGNFCDPSGIPTIEGGNNPNLPFAPINAFDMPEDRTLPPRSAHMQPPEGFVGYASSPNVLPPPGASGDPRPYGTYPGTVGNYPNYTWPWTNIIPYPDKTPSDGWVWMHPDPSPPPSPMTPTEAPRMTPSYMYR